MIRVRSFAIGLSVLSVAGVMASGMNKEVEAKPPFAGKEGKPCAYCHVDGPAKARNYRGLYYKANNLTFAGFDDAAEAKKAGVEVGPDPDPTTKPKSWTAPVAKEGDKPAETKPTETKADAVTKAQEEKKPTVAELEAKVKAAETAAKAKPTDKSLKKAHAAALADLGHAVMLDNNIPPRNRYPRALKHFREALALDPSNKLAQDDKKTIEEVYKSMGRPVPQN